MSFLNSRPLPPSVFPTFLIPSLPFRRRKSSTRSTDSTDSTVSSVSTTSSVPPEGRYLNGHTSHLRCSRCATDLCLTTQIISKGFTGRHGRAYLVSGTPSPTAISATPITNNHTSLPNTYTHKAVPRQLVTGAHTVSDISCVFCGSVLGWKYVAAEEETQRYKVGKFILETKRVMKASTWENEAEDDDEGVGERKRPMPPNRLDSAAAPGEDQIEFDSQDEDECEDLFAGVWSPALAARRRRGRRFGRSGNANGDGQRARSEEVC